MIKFNCWKIVFIAGWSKRKIWAVPSIDSKFLILPHRATACPRKNGQMKSKPTKLYQIKTRFGFDRWWRHSHFSPLLTANFSDSNFDELLIEEKRRMTNQFDLIDDFGFFFKRTVKRPRLFAFRNTSSFFSSFLSLPVNQSIEQIVCQTNR